MNAIIDTGLSPLIVPPKEEVVLALRAAVPPHCVLSREEDTRPYECDGLSLYRSLPMAVVLPETEAQVQNILKVCKRLNVPVRGPRCGYGLVGWCDAACSRRFTRTGQVQSNQAD